MLFGANVIKEIPQLFTPTINTKDAEPFIVVLLFSHKQNIAQCR